MPVVVADGGCTHVLVLVAVHSQSHATLTSNTCVPPLLAITGAAGVICAGWQPSKKPGEKICTGVRTFVWVLLPACP